eukprot:s1480_g5.t4
MLCAAMGVSPPKPPVLCRMRMRRKPKAPRRFLAEVCAGLGACELRRLLRSCCRPLRSALRASRRRTMRPRSLQQRLAQEGFSMTPSPFCADGFFVGVSDTLSCQEPKLGESLLHLSGEVYGQEATSTLPVEALRMAMTAQNFGDTKLHVLDLCAAPGSKASQVASQLQPDVLIVNEPRKERAALLQANLLRAGVAEALVLCLDGRKVGALAPNSFNVVLVDAPCSGEGTVRKDPTAWDRWASTSAKQMEDIHHSEHLTELFLAVQQRFRSAQVGQGQQEVLPDHSPPTESLDSPGGRENSMGNSPKISPRRRFPAESSPREVEQEPIYSDYSPGGDGFMSAPFETKDETLDYFSNTATHCYNVGFHPTKPPPKAARTPEARHHDRVQRRNEKKMTEDQQLHAELSKRPDDSMFSAAAMSGNPLLAFAPWREIFRLAKLNEGEEETLNKLVEARSCQSESCASTKAMGWRVIEELMKAAQDNHSSQLKSRCDLQQELLRSAWAALQPGGLLVYSTCTLNDKENEMQCCWLQQQGAKVISLGAQPMATKSGKASLSLRVWPHFLDAEGFFVACFCKDADDHPELDKTKDADADAFESLDLRRLRPSEATLLKQRVRQELQYSLPEGIPVADEQGNVFLLPRHFPCIRGLLPHALTLGLRLTTQQRLSKELRLVAGGNLSSQDADEPQDICNSMCNSHQLAISYNTHQYTMLRYARIRSEWMELHSGTGGGLSAASLALKRAENAPAAAAAFQEMLQQRLTPDQVSYNTLLDAHAKSTDGTGAHQVLNEMMNTSVAPGVVSFTIVIEAYARAGDQAAAEEAGGTTAAWPLMAPASKRPSVKKFALNLWRRLEVIYL